MTIKEFSQNLQALYDEMGEIFSSYQKNSALTCLPGCGECCKNPQVEASVLEMIPLALKLYQENTWEEWIKRLAASSTESCVFYESHSPDGKLGRCGAYRERPSICRMFGVAGHHDKLGEVTLSICKLIKERSPELAEKKLAEVKINGAPLMIDWSYRLAQLDLALIQDRLPINQALLRALDKVLLYARYQDLT